METTFEKFIVNIPQEKKLFDEEYSQFILSELLLRKVEEARFSARSQEKEECRAVV